MVLVVDVSDNNPHPINWGAVKKAGYAAAIVKATQGDYYVNPYAEQDMADARSAGLYVAAYHFVDPTCTAISQIAFFKAHRFGCALGVIDSELAANGTANWDMTDGEWQAVANMTHDMLTGIAGFTKRQMLYSSPGFTLPGKPWGFAQWIADYSVSKAPAGASLWQYTETGKVSGISGNVDLSRCASTFTLADLANLFGAAPVPAPKPTPAPKPLTVPGPATAYAKKQGMVIIDVAEARLAINAGISYYVWKANKMVGSRSKSIPAGVPLFAFAKTLNVAKIPHAGA